MTLREFLDLEDEEQEDYLTLLLLKRVEELAEKKENEQIEDAVLMFD